MDSDVADVVAHYEASLGETRLAAGLADEISSAGLSVVEIVWVEGLAGWLPQLEHRWAQKADREVILDAVRLVEAEPSLLGLSAHLPAVARPAQTLRR